MSEVRELIEALVAEGVDAVTAAEIVTRAVLHGASNAPKKRSAGAIRQERYRRNKASQVTESDACDGGVTPPPDKDAPHTPQENNPLPQKKTPPTGGQKKRGSRIPDDFEPDVEYAVAQGLHRDRAQTEAANFVDYWRAKTGQNATKLDWPATWRTWVRNARDRYGGSSPGRPPPAGGPQRLTPAESARRRLEELENEQSDQSEIPFGRYNIDG